MSLTLDLNKEYKTRDGRVVTVTGMQYPNPYKPVGEYNPAPRAYGYIRDNRDTDFIGMVEWHLNGCRFSGVQSQLDLVEEYVNE